MIIKPGSDNVKFMAYFLRDGKKVDGTSNRVGYSDTIYFDLKMTEGTLENAKIEIGSQNFYLETNLMSDSVISQNYVSKNTKEIAFNNLSGNIEKTFDASVKSGDYEFTTSITDAIGNDVSNYSKENIITFTADYIDNAGQKTEISKEIPLNIMWYGEVNSEIPEKIYGSDNLVQKYGLLDYLDIENNEMTIEFNIGTQETENEVILNKSYIEGTIPLINEIAPTNVVIEGEKVEYTYDQDTREFTASRTANIEGNIVAEQAYSGIYAQNEINYKYNEYKVKATYPIEAYQADDDEYINIDIPVTAHYEGVNGERSNDVTKNINVSYSNMNNKETGFDVSIGRHVLYPEERQVVSKHNVLLGYRYNNTNTNLWQSYYTKWNIVTNPEESAQNVVLTDNSVEDKFITNAGEEIENNGYITNKGIAFTNPVSALGLDGWIKVYDDETDELLHTFTADDWSDYDILNPYEYEKDVKYIRIETSEVSENSFGSIYNIKQINTEKIVDAFSESEVENMKFVETSFNGKMQINGEAKNLETTARANFEEEISVVNFDVSEGDINTQQANNIQLEIAPNMTQYNTATWKNEQYLIKFPSDIIDVKINDVTINNADGVSISDYYEYAEAGSTFIKIEMNGSSNTNYQLLLDCTVATNPNTESKKAEIELYAYNKRNNIFYETEISEDIYDINNNANTKEKIGKKKEEINIVRPETLLSNQSTTIDGKTIYNPLVAMVENSDRTATIDIDLQNNDKDNITDIKLLGKIPFEGNTYVQSEEELGSTYTAKIISDGINLPEELAKRAIIYYSEQEKVTDDPTDEKSGWVQKVDDYSNVKNFLILFNSYQMAPDETLRISYDIKIPDDATYNEVAYSTHTIYYSEYNGNEVERKTADISKLGFNIARRFDFELTKYSRQDNRPIQGVSFKITEIGNRLNSIVVETNAEGKITIPDLLLEKNYTIQEIGVPDEYIINTNIIEFRAYEQDGELKLDITGEFEDEPKIDQGKALISATLYNEVKYDFDITNINENTEGVKSTFTLEGKGETQKAITDENGKLVFEGLYPEEEYIIRQTYSKGYYIEEAKEIKFKISRGENGLEVIEDTSGLISLNTENGKIKPTASIKINSEKIPTYNLKVVLYENESIIPLEDSDYTITGGGKEDGESYTTDAKGSFTVKDLYAYVEGKNETAEYTLKQTNPPTGYALSSEEVKFKVTRNQDTQELTLDVLEGTIREDYTIENDTVTISLDARKLFKITTIDGENTELLPGVKVLIKESVIIDNEEVFKDPTDEYGNVLGKEEIINGEPCRVFTTNENGEIEEPLKDGIYKLVKIEVPKGYELEENEEDRTYFVGIGETRGAEVETSFRDPLLMDNEKGNDPDQYFVAGREDGKAMYYHNGELSIINDENQIEKTISSDHVYQILAREDGFDVLTDSSIIRYNDNLEILDTFNLTNGMRYFDRCEDGSYVVTGSFEGTKTVSGSNTASGSDISIQSIQTKEWWQVWWTDTIDIFVMKVNSSGKVESLVNIGGEGEDVSTYIKIMDDGKYLISSHMTSDSIGASMSDTGSELSGDFTDTFFIMNNETMKVSKITSVKTSRGNTTPTNGNLHRTFQGKDGAIYYTGQLTGSVTFGANETVSGRAITVTSTGSSDAYIVKYNTDGKVMWAINVGGLGTDHLYSAEITTDGGILLGGDSENGRITVPGDKTSSGMDISTEPISDNAGTWRGIAIKIDDDGRVVWANEFGYSTDEGCYAVSGFTENSYALCGFETYSTGTPVFIRVDEAVKQSEISEVEGIEIPSLMERYNITTSVNGVGGTITGQDDELVETVKYGENSTKEIVITPDEGYEILSIIINDEKIEFTPDESGAVTLEKFTNVTENINIVAEFSNNTSKIIVHHYLLGTDDTKIAEDDVLVGIVGTEYTTGPKIGLVGYTLATNEDGEYVITGNPSGNYDEYDQEVVYYYVEQDVKVTVNHFIEGTTTPLSKTIVTEYKKGQTYSTDVATDIPEEYELVKMPSNATGVIEESEIVVTYYYRLKPTYQYKIEYYFDGELDSSLTETGEAIEGKLIDSYTDKVKDGYVFDNTENLPLTISTNKEDNVIKIYYKAREDLSYKIEYYYDGIIDDEKTITVNNVKFGTVISEFTDKVIEGYQFEKTENYPLTVSTNNDANVIKIYYTVRKDLYYTVNYLEQGTENKLAESKEVGGNTYNAVITEKPIDIEGYNKVSDRAQSIVIGVNEAENVINFYYTKRDDLSYTVNYLEQGTNEKIADSKQVDNQTFKDSVTEEAINIPGYYAVDQIKQTITIEVENNIINFYYQKRTDIEYTVEYYYDGEINEEETEKYMATFQDIIEEYEDKNITGYKLDKTENLPLTISANEESNVIKVYYVKDTFKYTVEYYYDGIINEDNTEEYTATFQDKIIEYEDKNITGYKLDKTENLPLTVTENADNNVIKVYYVKDVFGYKVEYYYDGKIDNSKTQTIEATFGDRIDTYEDKNITGYKLDKTENLPLTVSENVENNVIKIYYIKDQFNYTVEYYYDNEIDEGKTETLEATYQDVIEEYEDKNITGYRLDRTDNLPLTITEKSENNVIKVYYVKRTDLSYTVNYYEEGTEDKLAESKVVNNVTFNEVITENPIDIEGYNKVSEESKQITIGVENNVINFYYTKRTDLSYTVKYLEQGTDEELAETKTVEGQTFKDSVTEEAIDIPGYNAQEPTEVSITIEVDNNEIIFYYTKKTDIKYKVEYYYDGQINESNTETLQATYKEVIEDYEDKIITGYKLEKTENLPLTISANEEENVIKVYYVKNTFKYTVEYYYDGILNEENTEEYTATFQDVIENYEDKNITGYKLAKTENLPLTVTENAEKNIIKVYYVKDVFGYTVEYYYDGNIDNTKTETIEATYGDVIENYEDKNITGYKLEKTENLPLTVSENVENNVIKVYYIKDTFKYTVEYYYDGKINEENTEEYTATFQDEITEYEDKNITGYKLEKTENLPLTVTENPDNNVIKVYYVKDQFSYTVEYYYDNAKDEALTENYTATYQDVIESYVNKVKDGYRLEKVEGLPLTISENLDNNVIRVYYVRKDTKVIVKYLEKDTNKVLDESANYEIAGKVFDEYETEQKEFTGYNFVESTNNTKGTMTEEPIEVIYYYVLKTPYLTDEEISKNGTVMIENLDDEITYNISYKVNLQDYMGQAQITIVDTLPYAIDTSKSSLDSGEYNAENNTITWVETISDIYSYENRNNEIEINKTITVVYLGLEQETTSIENRVTANIKTQTPEKEFEAKEATSITTTGFTVNIPVSKIWDDEGNKLGNRPESVVFKLNGSDGSEYSQTIFSPGMPKSVAMQDSDNPNKWNYIFENLPKYDAGRNEIVYTLSEEESTEGDLKYYDTSINHDTKEVTNTDKYGKVTVHYYIQNVDGTTTTNRVPDVNGTEIPDVIIEGKEGDSYTVSEAQNVNDKYELVEEKLPPSEGTIQKYNEGQPQEVIYYYRLKPAKVIINYIEQDEDAMSLATQEVIEGHVDDIYNTNTDYRKETISKDGKTYTLIQDSGNTEGQMTVSDIVVTYYYLQNTKATVRYVEGNPETGEIVKDLEAPRTEEGLVGDEFVTNEKAFIGYRLIKSPENTTIKMTKEEQTLIYYYEAVYTGLVENHIDDKTGKVLYTEVHQIQVGQNYKISSKEFEGYDLVETKLPENSTGTMEEELVTVNYYYIKKTVLEVNYVNVLTNEPLTEKIVDNTKHEGDSYTTEQKEFTGYDLVEVPANSTGTMEVQTDADGDIVNNKTVVTYYYAQKAQVEEHHIDILTNDEIEEPTIHDGHVGDEYNIPSKEFLSYALVTVDEEGNTMLPANSTGKMTEEKIVVTYYYNQPAKVIVHYVDRVTGKELEETNEEGKLQSSQVVIEGQKDDDYSTEAKDFKYYTLVERPLEEQGKMKVEITKDENGNDIVVNTIDIYYYYEPKPFNIGVDKIISKITIDGEEQNIGNDKLTRVEIYRKNVDDTDVKVEYTIKVKNTGEVDGTATIRENIPEGMSLVSNDGTWEEKDGYIEKVITDIKAGETKEYKITLSWNKGNKNLGEKDNTVEIIKTGNIPGFKDQNADDNSSTARVLINVSTGSVPWPLVIALIALVGLEGVTLGYANVLTRRQKKINKK